MSTDPAALARRRDLRLILTDGLAFSVMVGMGEAYIAAFALALGLGEVVAGLVVTVPLLAGGLLQLVTPAGVRWLRSRRRWTVLCASLQALAFAPLAAGALAGRLPAWAVFAAATGYWAAGMAAGPAWNVWVERLVPRQVRLRFFARRTGLVQLGVLVSLVGSAAVLEWATAAGHPLRGFAAIFLAAALGRAVSARVLAAQSESPQAGQPPPGMSPRALLREFRGGEGGRLLVYLLAFTTSVTVASPYFSPFMLARLRFSYWEYMALVGTALLAKVLVLSQLARAARRFGLDAMLRLAWFGILGLPALWLVSQAFGYLALLQVISGTFWATQEYAVFLLLFETIPAARRVAMLTAYNLGNALATVTGSLIGAAIFHLAGQGMAGYVAIFAASSAARALCVVLLLRVRGAQRVPRPVSFRLDAVRPGMGAVLKPVLATVRRGRWRAAQRREAR
ncbi:MFS transporter [bacterium]|nr:MFS transporter [bacterium]